MVSEQTHEHEKEEEEDYSVSRLDDLLRVLIDVLLTGRASQAPEAESAANQEIEEEQGNDSQSNQNDRQGNHSHQIVLPFAAGHIGCRRKIERVVLRNATRRVIDTRNIVCLLHLIRWAISLDTHGHLDEGQCESCAHKIPGALRLHPSRYNKLCPI